MMLRFRQQIRILLTATSILLVFSTTLMARGFQKVQEGTLEKLEVRLSQTTSYQGDNIEIVILPYDVNKNLIRKKLYGDIYLNGQKRPFVTDNGLGVVDVTTDFLYTQKVSIYAQIAKVKSPRTDLSLLPRLRDRLEIIELSDWRFREFSLNAPRLTLPSEIADQIQEGTLASIVTEGENLSFSIYKSMKNGQNIALNVLNYTLGATDSTYIHFNSQKYPLPNFEKTTVIGKIGSPQLSLFVSDEYIDLQFNDFIANDGGFLPDGTSVLLATEIKDEVFYLSTQILDGSAKFDFAPRILLGREALLLIAGETFRFDILP